ncbi:hexapeptide transferase, partial [Candidatus Bipolaricaulota bacterium]|nr:hexapeptide transferase [Candidatus Bipolaricaulota bacterium]
MILGAGGHAKVLVDSLIERPDVEIIVALDPDPAKKGQNLLGVPISDGDHLLSELLHRGVTHFVVGLGSTRDNRPRRRLFDMARIANLMPLSVIHPSAAVSPHSELGPGCQILAGAIINADGQVGCNTIVNSGGIVEHDCRV